MVLEYLVLLTLKSAAEDVFYSDIVFILPYIKTLIQESDQLSQTA